MTVGLAHQKTVQMKLEDCYKVDIRVNSPLSFSSFGSRFSTVRLEHLLIPTYSHYFLTQFGLFLFVHVKYYVELGSLLPCSYFY